MSGTTTTFDGAWSIAAVHLDFRNWSFGRCDVFSFLGIGVLQCGPLRVTFTRPPERATRHAAIEDFKVWALRHLSLPARIAYVAAIVGLAVGLVGDVVLRVRDF